MKISRIEEATLTMSDKLGKIMKELGNHSSQLKDQKHSIHHLNAFISKNEEEGITPHDMKRIKKEIKIMKTNFETAFSSMTDQINRKLVKEENIMKSLSEEIGLLAEDNKNIKEVLTNEQKTLASLNSMMSGYMKENEERLENIINDSFSSKRSKNSFEYGLDLKNLSGEESKSQNYENLSKKFD
jgi:hypothetical protein